MGGINEREDRYEPYKNDPKVSELLAKARKTNKERDASDHKAGFASPDITVQDHVRTAMCAIGCGVSFISANKNREGATAIAEGLAMLEDAELLLRKKQHGVN